MKRTKMFLNRFFILILFLLIADFASGKRFSETILDLGKDIGVDSVIRMSGKQGQIKYDDTLNKLRFSNDSGGVFQDLGSGGGGAGGVNFLENPDFETGVDNWTGSGSSVLAAVSSGGNLLVGDGSATWDASAAAENLDSDLMVIPNGFKNGECSAKMLYLWDAGSSGDIKFQALDNSGNILSEVELEPTANAVAQPISLGFECPSGSDTGRLRLRSTANAAIIAIDQMRYGETVVQELSRSQIVLEAHYPTTGGCTWTVTNTAYTSFAAVASCAAIVTDHLAAGFILDVTENDLPQIILSNLPPGKYFVEADIPASSGVVGAGQSYRLTDGSTNGPGTHLARATSGLNPGHVSGTFVYTSTGNRTFSIQAAASSGASTILSEAQLRTLNFKVRRYPLNSENSYAVDAAGFSLDVNIGGANPSLGVSSVSSYTEIINAGLDMVINSGSAGAQIPCDTTNNSNGLTCSSGSESLGVVFDAPFAGKYKVCGSFTHNVITGAAGTLSAAFQWVETPNNAQTILQEGNDRAAGNHSTATLTHQFPRRVCGEFEFLSAGQKTLRLMYEQLTGGTITTSSVNLDREATVGQIDLHITVHPISRIVKGVTFPELIISKGANQLMNFVSVEIDGTGTPAVVSGTEFGDWISGAIVDNGVGNWTVNFKVGVFSSTPNCTCMSSETTASASSYCMRDTASAPSATLIRIGVSDETGSPDDGTFTLQCHGPLN